MLFYLYIPAYQLYYTGNSRPTHEELYEKVTPSYAAHWMRIGVFLGIHYPILEIIESDCLGNCQKCCDTMLAKWLDVDNTASWEKLIHSIDLATSDGTSMS